MKQKLAKALEYVALGDPHRLRHHVSNLTEHLADDDELVRYHLSTALVVVGSESPESLAIVADELVARLDDESPFVQGRAAEALGQLVGAETDVALPASRLEDLRDAQEAFVAERARFALSALGETQIPDEPTADVGTVQSIRESTTDAVKQIRSPDTDGECPSCGFPLPDAGPPMCPQCGSPH